MNEIKKLNPLLEAMNDIDDAIISEAAPEKRRRPKYLKPMIIAAAAAVLCGATAVTATASIKMREHVTFNGVEPNDLGYDIYTDEHGCEIRTYTFNLPDYCLLEEVEGCTSAGKLRAAHSGSTDEGKVDWYLIDEKGNIFNEGVNNVKVVAECTGINEYGGKSYGSASFCVSNFNEVEYWTETHSNSADNTLGLYVHHRSPEAIQRIRDILEQEEQQD